MESADSGLTWLVMLAHILWIVSHIWHVTLHSKTYLLYQVLSYTTKSGDSFREITVSLVLPTSISFLVTPWAILIQSQFRPQFHRLAVL